jgi:hypothetical protein
MRTLGRGFVVLAIPALLLVWLDAGFYNLQTWTGYADFYLWVLLGPIYLIRTVGGLEPTTLVFALGALVRVASTVLLRRRLRLVAAIIGFSLWVLCEMLVAGAGA